MTEVMLKAGSILYILIVVGFIYSCNNPNQKSQQLFIQETSINTVGEDEYWNVYNLIVDSINSWDKNDLDNFNFERTGKKIVIDSVLCFNSEGNMLVSVLLNLNYNNPVSDGLDEFFGAKIDSQWYFWRGGYTPVGRTGLKGHDPTKPLPYSYLHKMGVGSLGGYLDKDGNIRDEWFEAKFKSGRFPYEMRYKYKWILDGKRIDNEDDYWNYSYWKSGTKLWADKAHRDSITKMKQENIQ